MAIDKNRKKSGKGQSRDGGGFIAIPWAVIDSSAYAALSHPARSLLLAIARQYCQNNNGRLLTSFKCLSKQGWKSSDVISRAKIELINGGFIYETVKGHRPNKASWYAITWQDLDKIPGYDYGAFEGWKNARSAYKNNVVKITPLIPPQGPESSRIAPSDRLEVNHTSLPGSATKTKLDNTPTPSDGNHLEVPSAVVLDASVSGGIW